LIAIVCLVGAGTVGATSSNDHYVGSFPGSASSRPIVGVAATRSGKGYWLAASDGGVFTFGDAKFYGSTGGMQLGAPIVGIASAPSGNGYWLVARDGGVFTFGKASFFGSTGGMQLGAPIVGIAPTPSGNGYWLAAADGGVFTFGDASFYGSTGAQSLSAPIVGIAPTPSGNGYWLAGADGSVFTFGDAMLHGASGARPLRSRIVGIAPTQAAYGYWLVAANGTTVASGHARAFRTQFPSLSGSSRPVNANPADAIAASPTGGYFITSVRGAVGVSTTQPAPAPTTTTTTTTTSPPVPAAALVPAPAAAPRRPATAAPHTAPLIALQLLFRMNAERSARNLVPLAWDPLLASRAGSWAHTLLANDAFHHQNLQTIANAARGRFEELGENIFAGGGSAADSGAAHVGFMRSADHRANMLMPQGQLVGIGAACLNGKLIVVEDFAIRMGAPLPPAGQPVPPMDPIVAPRTNGASC
jgi:uncharacterized protein YkwD